MAGLPLIALNVWLFISAGESHGFSIHTEHSRITATVGGEAFFNVKPSVAISGGNWVFNGTTIIQWVGTGESIHNAYKLRAELFTNNGSLLLKSVKVSDSGEYRVDMTPNSGSNAQLTIAVRVLGESQGFTIHTAHSRITATVGGDAFFNVKPSAAIIGGNWEFNGTTIAQWAGTGESINNAYKPRVELFTNNGSLLVKSVKVSDSGEYRVDMTPRSGSNAQLTIALRVLEAVSHVSVSTTDSTPVENVDTITLTCHAMGSVQNRTWLKNTQPIQENGRIFTSPDNAKLSIISVNRNDAGTYKCIARNDYNSGFGEIDLQVYYSSCGFSAGAIAGIGAGLLGVALISGIGGWLFGRKTGGAKVPSQTKYDARITSSGKSTLVTDAANAVETYENIARNDHNGSANAPDGDSTYMGLKMEDRSVYSDLKR